MRTQFPPCANHRARAEGGESQRNVCDTAWPGAGRTVWSHCAFAGTLWCRPKGSWPAMTGPGPILLILPFVLSLLSQASRRRDRNTNHFDLSSCQSSRLSGHAPYVQPCQGHALGLSVTLQPFPDISTLCLLANKEQRWLVREEQGTSGLGDFHPRCQR